MASGKSSVRGSERLVDYLLDETLDSVSQSVETQARRRIVDTLAAITVGYGFEEMEVTRSFAREQFGAGPVTILDGQGQGLNVSGGTLVNSLAANVLDIDDGHRLAQGHPAAVITPAALAAAQTADRTVRDLLEAFIPAYEIAIRQALAMHEWAGMHTGTGAWGAVGAAAAVASLRDLPREQAVEALGLAEFNAPITPVMRSVVNPSSSMAKDGIGWGGYVGMTASLLAERGLSGSGTVFDGIEHEGPDQTLLDSLGEQYQLLNGYFKPYPACRWVHSGLDALDELLANNDIDVTAIQAVDVYTHRKGAKLRINRPTTPSEAEYSYPFTVAAALLNDGEFTPAELGRLARENDAILDLADRVTMHVDAEADDRYPEESLSRIEIVTEDATYESALVNPRGSRERPLSVGELERKWTKLLDPVLGNGTTDRLLTDIAADDLPINELLSPWLEGSQ